MLKLKKIYEPKCGKLMNSIAFASTSGSNIEALHKNAEGYKIRAVFVDKKCKAMERAKRLGIPVIYESGVKFCGKWSDAKINGSDAIIDYYMKCKEYEKVVIDKLNNFAYDNHFDIDMIFLAGYMRLVKSPMLKEFKDRMINVHPANLAITDSESRRIFTGDNAVFDAIISGEKETYSTVHIVTQETDCGEIITLSEPLKVKPTKPELEELIKITSKHIKSGKETPAFVSLSMKYADDLSGSTDHEKLVKFASEHQEKQKKYCDWSAYIKAAKLIAQGRVAISNEKNLFGTRTIYIDGKGMPYEGYTL